MAKASHKRQSNPKAIEYVQPSKSNGHNAGSTWSVALVSRRGTTVAADSGGMLAKSFSFPRRHVTLTPSFTRHVKQTRNGGAPSTMDAGTASPSPVEKSLSFPRGRISVTRTRPGRKRDPSDSTDAEASSRVVKALSFPHRRKLTIPSTESDGVRVSLRISRHVENERGPTEGTDTDGASRLSKTSLSFPHRQRVVNSTFSFARRGRSPLPSRTGMASPLGSEGPPLGSEGAIAKTGPEVPHQPLPHIEPLRPQPSTSPALLRARSGPLTAGTDEDEDPKLNPDVKLRREPLDTVAPRLQREKPEAAREQTVEQESAEGPTTATLVAWCLEICSTVQAQTAGREQPRCPLEVEMMTWVRVMLGPVNVKSVGRVRSSSSPKLGPVFANAVLTT